MSASRAFPAKHWHERAQELRSIAGAIKNDNNRRAILNIAESYSILAGRAVLREADEPIREGENADRIGLREPHRN